MRALLASALPALALAAVAAPAPAQRPGAVDTASFASVSLGTRKRVLVYLPPSYAARTTRRYPVLYYLHGMGGGEGDWAGQGRLPRAMDSLARRGAGEAIVVMPDGDDGWYTTWNVLASLSDCPRRAPEREGAGAYCVPWTRYDEYVARDLVAWTDSTYRTLPDRRHRAVAGLSMGGYGAVTLALRYPDVFRAAASHSGALSPLRGLDPSTAGPTPDAAALERSWGPRFWPYLRPVFGRDTLGWWARDPARLAARLHRESPALVPSLFVDAGRSDPLLGQSRAFRDALLRLGLRPRYAEWPGAHDWAYWRAHVGESLAWLLGEVGKGGDGKGGDG